MGLSDALVNDTEACSPTLSRNTADPGSPAPSERWSVQCAGNDPAPPAGCLSGLRSIDQARSELLCFLRSHFFKGGTHKGCTARASGRAQPGGPRPPSREAATTCCRTEGLECLRPTGLAQRRNLPREDSAPALSDHGSGLIIGPGHLPALRCGNPHRSMPAASTALGDSCTTGWRFAGCVKRNSEAILLTPLVRFG